MKVVPVSSLTVTKDVGKPHVVRVNDAVDSDDDDASDRGSVSSTSGVYSRLSTASEANAVSTTVAKSTSTQRQRRGCNRVLYAYPRLCFVLVLLGTAFGTGAYSAYHLALWTLEVTGTRHALATARTQLVATELTLRQATACALSQIPTRAVVVKTRVEQGVTPWRDKLEASTAHLAAASANLTRCTTRELDRIERLFFPNASTPIPTPVQRDCLGDQLQTTLSQYQSSSSSFSWSWLSNTGLRRVKQLVKKIRVRKQLEQMSIKKKNETVTLQSLATNTSNAIVAVVDAWLNELDTFVTTTLETVGIPEIHLPDMPMTAGLEVFLGLTQSEKKNPLSLVSGQQVMTALRSIAGTNREWRRALDVLEKSLKEMLSLLKSLDERESRVREELTDIQTAVQAHVQQSLAQFKNATIKLEKSIAVQTRTSIDAFAGAVMKLFRVDASHDLEAVWKHLSGWEENGLILNDSLPNPEQTPWLERVKLEPTFDALGEALKNGRGPEPDVDQAAHRDKWMYRASLYDASAVLVTILLTWDFMSRLGWFLGKLARLLTESYSDLPPVDIRDNTSITTLIDFWGVLTCRHDLTSVLVALMTEGSYVIETAVHFVLWVLLEIAGTLALMAWNQAIADRCRPTNGHLDFSVVTPAAVITYLLAWIGDSSTEALSPTVAVSKQAALMDKALDDDERAWRTQVHTAAQVQAGLVDTLILERRIFLDVREHLATCAIQEVDDDDAGDASLGCAMAITIAQAEPMAEWQADAVKAFHHERMLSNFHTEAIIAECLSHGRQPTTSPDQLVGRLEHAHSCLVDQTLYLGVASWWMVLVIMLALRLTARMVVKAAGMVFWRYLSADRLEILAFSDEHGGIQSPERLPKAIRRHLRNIRWRVTARMLGVALGFSSVLVIGLHVLPLTVLEPML